MLNVFNLCTANHQTETKSDDPEEAGDKAGELSRNLSLGLLVCTAWEAI